MIQFFKKWRRRILFPEHYPLRHGPKGTFVFVHINKTGGTSISKAIGLPHKVHWTAKELVFEIGQNAWDKAYKFSVVRNPWAKVVSQYHYRVKTQLGGMQTSVPSFIDWVEMTYGDTKNPIYYNEPKMFLSQVEWLKDKKGKVSINKIMRFERLEEEFSELSSELGLQSTLPYLNRTASRKNYMTFYTSKSRMIIEQYFKDDIEMFGYKFGE